MMGMKGATAMRDSRERMILEQCKRAIQRLAPEARVLLYGSRARGTAAPDSDYDLLVLTPTRLDPETIRRIRDILYELELEHGVVISTLFYSEEEWREGRRRATPFYQEVEEQGIVI
jgi:predicted nucleotidyltransferase